MKTLSPDDGVMEGLWDGGRHGEAGFKCHQALCEPEEVHSETGTVMSKKYINKRLETSENLVDNHEQVYKNIK